MGDPKPGSFHLRLPFDIQKKGETHRLAIMVHAHTNRIQKCNAEVKSVAHYLLKIPIVVICRDSCLKGNAINMAGKTTPCKWRPPQKSLKIQSSPVNQGAQAALSYKQGLSNAGATLLGMLEGKPKGSHPFGDPTQPLPKQEWLHPTKCPT